MGLTQENQVIAVEERVIRVEEPLLDSNVEVTKDSDSDAERLLEVEATRSEKV